MPISSIAVIPHVLNEVLTQQPKSVLDIGIGNGMYGALIRNYKKDVSIHGIEVFPQYENLNWKHYDSVIIGKAEDFTPIQKYDSIICCDVIEHLSKDAGILFIEKMKSWLNPGGEILISTPSIFCEQGAVGGNEFERHLSLWDINEFASLGFGILKDGTPDNFGHWMIVAKFKL